MKNVKIVKAKRVGYFLTIGEDNIKNRWAVTALELLTLWKMLGDMENEIRKEVYELER